MRKLTYKILYEEYVRLKKEKWWHIYSYNRFRFIFCEDKSMTLSKMLKKEPRELKWDNYIREYQAEYRRKNKERLTEYQKEYYNNTGKYKRMQRNNLQKIIDSKRELELNDKPNIRLVYNI